MPSPKSSSTDPTSATKTLNDHSTSTPPPSPLSALTASITLKTPNQNHIHDSTLSLPIGATLNISRKNGGRIGQSILGQLLATHRPERDQQRLASDVALSQETIRPKDQQRRSILPTGWTMGFSKSTTIQGFSLTSLTGGKKVATGDISTSDRNVKETTTEPNEHQHPMLPSVWLENVLSRLSRSDLKTSPPYATLPRAGLSEQKATPLRTMFLDPKAKERKDEKTLTTRLKSMSSSSTLNQKSKNTLTPLESKTLSRRGSACELALGEDGRALFHQNRPKTLSSAIISSSIASAKESLEAGRQRPSDTTPKSLPTNLPKSAESTESSPPPTTTTTTKTTRGRFTI
ncbi:hypothetical protein BGX31_004775, partial [Mortierella sp. GBA43]